MRKGEYIADRVLDKVKKALRSSEMEKLKIELIKLIRSHKDHCGGGCSINLLNIRLVAEETGMTFSEEEIELFNVELAIIEEHK